MAKPKLPQWIGADTARRMINNAFAVTGAGLDRFLLAALRDGVQARAFPASRAGPPLKTPYNLDADFFARMNDLDSIDDDKTSYIQIDRLALALWLNGADSGRPGPGRKKQIEWEDMFIELIARANTPDGIDANISRQDLALDMISWFEATNRQVPDKSTIEKKLTPVLERLRN